VKYEKSRILDQMIENELIFETAEEESIIVSDKKVIQQLEEPLARFFSSRISKDASLKKTVDKVSKEMERFMEKRFEVNYKIDPDLKMFIDYVEKSEKMDFASFFNEIRVKITREQIISLTIGMTPPSAEDAKKWYKANRSKLGFEVYVKHILVIPKSGSLSDEKEANNKAEDIRRQILANPASFESLAAKYSQDPGSSKKGGDLGWQMIAQFDPYFANNVARLSSKGEISSVFKSSFGYHIVKYMGKRDITYDKVERMIMYMLYTEKGQEQFKKWIQQKREEASVIIHMDYVKS
ncbi:MAG: peptidylprolyl isomerase, partial [Leptospirales bacterium]|nr:peptidylprolyl isomerase [Leptospirales bacterium]